MIEKYRNSYETEFTHNVVYKEVVSPIRYILQSYSVNTDLYHDYTNKIRIAVSKDYTFNSRRYLVEFLSNSNIGAKVVELGIPVSVEEYEEAQTMTKRINIVGHFTNDTMREFDKYRMLLRLSGD